MPTTSLMTRENAGFRSREAELPPTGRFSGSGGGLPPTGRFSGREAELPPTGRFSGSGGGAPSNRAVFRVGRRSSLLHGGFSGSETELPPARRVLRVGRRSSLQHGGFSGSGGGAPSNRAVFRVGRRSSLLPRYQSRLDAARRRSRPYGGRSIAFTPVLFDRARRSASRFGAGDGKPRRGLRSGVRVRKGVFFEKLIIYCHLLSFSGAARFLKSL